jgi:hypothetical protein
MSNNSFGRQRIALVSMTLAADAPSNSVGAPIHVSVRRNASRMHTNPT